MASLNKVTLIGRLGKDPESKTFGNGGKIVNLRLATTESWKDKNSGEWKEKTEWHAVVVVNENLQNAAERMAKGAMIYVEGQIQTRKFAGNDGVEKYVTEIVVPRFRGELKRLDAAPRGDGGSERQDSLPMPERRPAPAGRNGAAPAQQRRPAPAQTTYDLDDDIPF